MTTRVGWMTLMSALLMAAIIYGCSGGATPAVGHDISAAQLEAMMADGLPLVILDVRSPAEYDGGHIAGSINIPLSELEVRLNELQIDTRTACVCTTGVRSAQAAHLLLDHGFFSVYNLEGGLRTWLLPLEPSRLSPEPAA